MAGASRWWRQKCASSPRRVRLRPGDIGTLATSVRHDLRVKVSVSNETSESCRILVADDDAPLRKLIVTVLRRRRGTAIDVAVNGAEAIEQLNAGPLFSVLVLDLMMPTLSGWDVIEWLAENRARAPRSVIVVSAADRAILKRVDPTVVNAIIFKPFDVFQLGAYVKSVCDLASRDRRRGRLVVDLSS